MGIMDILVCAKCTTSWVSTFCRGEIDSEGWLTYFDDGKLKEVDDQSFLLHLPENYLGIHYKTAVPHVSFKK